MSGDNFKVEVRSEGRKHFEAAVRLAWCAPGGKATHYLTPIPAGPCIGCCGSGKQYGSSMVAEERTSVEYRCKSCGGKGKVEPKSGMVLFWHEDHLHQVKSVALPFPLGVDAAVDFLWAWMENADFGKEPDHDGDNGKGFIVTTGDFWGHVEGSHYAFLGVYPDWQMYGK